VVLDELYRVLPRLTNVDRTIAINDQRFPALRYILQTSKQDLQGMTKFVDFPSRAGSRQLQRIEDYIDPKKSYTTIFTDDLNEIVLTQFGILNTGYLVGYNAGLNESDTVYTTLQLHKGYGLSLNVGLALAHKIKLVWGSELFDAKTLLDALVSQCITVIIAQPDEVENLLSIVTPKALIHSHLKKVILVSSPGNLATPELVERIKAGLKVEEVFVTFGIPETCGVITMTQANTTLEPNLVGLPLPHTEVRIVNEKGTAVPTGTTGDIAVKGFNVTSGQNNAQLAGKIKNDFLHTGIKAKLDKNKNVFVNST